jgi:hypothetical protein
MLTPRAQHLFTARKGQQVLTEVGHSAELDAESLSPETPFVYFQSRSFFGLVIPICARKSASCEPV